MNAFVGIAYPTFFRFLHDLKKFFREEEEGRRQERTAAGQGRTAAEWQWRPGHLRQAKADGLPAYLRTLGEWRFLLCDESAMDWSDPILDGDRSSDRKP